MKTRAAGASDDRFRRRVNIFARIEQSCTDMNVLRETNSLQETLVAAILSSPPADFCHEAAAESCALFHGEVSMQFLQSLPPSSQARACVFNHHARTSLLPMISNAETASASTSPPADSARSGLSDVAQILNVAAGMPDAQDCVPSHLIDVLQEYGEIGNRATWLLTTWLLRDTPATLPTAVPFHMAVIHCLQKLENGQEAMVVAWNLRSHSTSLESIINLWRRLLYESKQTNSADHVALSAAVTVLVDLAHTALEQQHVTIVNQPKIIMSVPSAIDEAFTLSIASGVCSYMQDKAGPMDRVNHAVKGSEACAKLANDRAIVIAVREQISAERHEYAHATTTRCQASSNLYNLSRTVAARLQSTMRRVNTNTAKLQELQQRVYRTNKAIADHYAQCQFTALRTQRRAYGLDSG